MKSKITNYKWSAERKGKIAEDFIAAWSYPMYEWVDMMLEIDKEKFEKLSLEDKYKYIENYEGNIQAVTFTIDRDFRYLRNLLHEMNPSLSSMEYLEEYSEDFYYYLNQKEEEFITSCKNQLFLPF